MIILFDLDGTLIDSTEAIVLSFNDVFEHFNDDARKHEEITSLIGHPLEEMFVELGITKNVDEYVLKYKEFYRSRSIPMTSLLPKAKESVKLASNFARLGIVTTKVSERSKVLLKHLELLDYFEVIVGRDNVTNPKPHPEPIYTALEQMGNIPSKEKCFMIGDTCLDIKASQIAGINGLGVLCGYGTHEKFQSCNTQHVFDNVHEAVSHILKETKTQ